MPLYKRCCICGRLCGDNPKSAEPYRKNGFACDECHQKVVVPSLKWKGNKYNKYENNK